MGRMLTFFITDANPQEVMTYADLEWSDGSTYRRLGFFEESRKGAVTFWVDPVTFERKRTPPGIEITNLGSIKYLLRVR